MTLASEQTIQPHEGALPNGFTRRQIASAISPRIQELILLPTEKCNFRCTYCYEDFELGKMSPVTQRAIEIFLEKRIPKIELLKFSWFGGEPLLATDVVLRLSEFAKDLCDRQQVKFQGGMTTNGYALEKALAEKLILLNQDFFQVTFDGWGSYHDELRKRADGRETFQKIWDNLIAMKSLNLKFEVCVRLHLRRDNLKNIELFLENFAAAFRGDDRFYLDFQHLRDMGGEGGKTIVNGISYKELLGIEAGLRSIYRQALAKVLGLAIPTEQDTTFVQKAANAGESAGSQRSVEYVHGEPYVCYASKANSILIRSNGRIGKCTVAFNDSRNDIGELAADGSIKIDNDKLRPWLVGLSNYDPEAAGCPIHVMPLEVKKIEIVKKAQVLHPDTILN